jgi:hypothetical protein
MMGFFVSSSKFTARIIHTASHLRQPMQFSLFSVTPPPLRFSSAWLGHTSIHAGSWQPRHTIAINPEDIPPTVRTLIALLISEWFF